MTSAYSRLTRQLTDVLTAHLKKKRRPVPEAGRLLWGAFHELSRARSWNAIGPNPITMGEIEAWARLARLRLQRQHVSVILALDEAFLKHAFEVKNQIPTGMKVSPVVSKHDITAALFDLSV